MFWLVAILLVLPFTASANSETRMTVEGMAWFDCDASWATIQDSQGNEIANGSEFTASWILVITPFLLKIIQGARV